MTGSGNDAKVLARAAPRISTSALVAAGADLLHRDVTDVVQEGMGWNFAPSRGVRQRPEEVWLVLSHLPCIQRFHRRQKL